jgi:hypothetical protein
MKPRLTVHHAVAFLGLILAWAVYSMMNRYLHVPSKIAWGSAILSILVVAIFWSAINLTTEEDEDD